MPSRILTESLERRLMLAVAPAGPEFRANSYTQSLQAYPATGMDADGDFVVVWQSNGQDQATGTNEGVYGQRYSAAGAVRGGEFRVNTTTAGNQVRPQVAMDPLGNFVVVWESDDGSGPGIFAQRYDAAGAAQGGEFRVNATTAQPQSFPAVAMGGDVGFVVTWVSSTQDLSLDGVYAQRFTPSGVPAGPEFRVNTETASQQRYPTVAIDLSGEFVVAWSSDLQDPDNSTGIYAQRFDAAGARQGGEFRVNTFTTSDQILPSLAMDGDGDFAVTWHGYEQNGNYGVFARRFDSGGLAQGGEFRVSNTVPGFQRNTAIAMDEDGDFVITWQDEHTGPAPGFTSVMARRFTSGGAAVAGEFLVNTTDVGHHRYPAAAMDADGDFVVAWAGYGQDPGDTAGQSGVYAQRYAEPRPTGAPRVTSVYVRGQGWPAPFLTYLQAQGLGSGTYGFALGGVGQLAALPWRNIDQITIRFDGEVSAGLDIRGVNVPTYDYSLSYDPSIRTAISTFAQPFGADKILIEIIGNSPGGLGLDGEWTAGGTFPSGDGAAGGDFRFRVNALPGDAGRDGQVNATDVAEIKRRLTRRPNDGVTDPLRAYTVFSDITGDGVINANDLAQVKARLTHRLPAAEPLVAISAGTDGPPAPSITRELFPDRRVAGQSPG